MPSIVPTRRSASSKEAREPERRRLVCAEERERLGPQGVYAYGLFGVAVVQLPIADAAFLIYGFYNDWHVPAAAIDAWLGGTIVQVIGAVLVVARALFASGTQA